ncbi:MAG: DedA family protein [Candidatus Nanopelagicaceae bacterium]|nr:DedA family protein [Candidatus Nanopelagicaceae bacterium]
MSIADWVEQYLGASTPFFIYAILGAIVFVETGILIAFFLPGDSILFAAGLVAATRDDTSIVLLVTVIFVAAFLGDQVGYVLGRKYGRAYLERRSSERIAKMVARAEDFYAKYGWSAVILARFYPWIRTFMPPIAGIGKMNYYKFLAANALGALLWGCGITLLGYYAASIPVLKDSSRGIALFFIVLTIAITIKNYLRSKRD